MIRLSRAYFYRIVYVRRRKGMFELALRHGVPIIPSYGFGETNAMNNVQWGMKWRSK